jgi:outer membrane protein assembly factor BamB
MKRLFLQFLTILIPATIAGAAAQLPGAVDWPMFRGDASLTGVAATTLPAKPELLWSFKTGGPVKSSPVVSRSRVFIGSDDASIYALNLKDGSKAWQFKADSHIEAPPTVYGDAVVFGTTGTNVVALNAANGEVLWRYVTSDKVLGAANIVPINGRPMVLFGGYDNLLQSLDFQTGKTNWTYETGNYINGTPAVWDGRTVFGGCDALLHILALTNGTKIAETDAGAYVPGSVALSDGKAFFGHYENEFLCIDLVKTNVVWRYRERNFPYVGSASVTADKVIFGGRDKRLHCLNKATGEQLWTFNTRGKIDGSPVVAGDKVVFGSADGRIYIVSLKDGSELWSYEIGQPISSSPAVAAGQFIIGSEDGTLYCFGEKK